MTGSDELQTDVGMPAAAETAEAIAARPAGARICGPVLFRAPGPPTPREDKEEIAEVLKDFDAGLLCELEMARRIQESFLPSNFPNLPGFSLAGYCKTARHVGGDFYDIFELPGKAALLVMADVMGKGVPAALFAGILRTLIRTTAELTPQPREILKRINRQMYQELSSVDMFITVQVALIDAGRKWMTVASGGHCPMVLGSSDGRTASVSPEGLPIGILPEAEFEEIAFSLEKIDFAILHTDGVTEAQDETGEVFGEIGLYDLLGRVTGVKQNASEISAAMLAELRRFQGRNAARDDQAFLVIARDRVD